MNSIKAWVITAFAVVSSLLGTLAIPVYILLGCNIIDYITGIAAAKNRGKEVSSYYGMMGIVKKVFMYLLVIIGVFVDIMLQYISTNLNLPIMLPYVVGCFVAVWLVLNEIISILENLNDIGIPMPPFLMPLVKRLKKQVEESAEDKEEQHEDRT